MARVGPDELYWQDLTVDHDLITSFFTAYGSALAAGDLEGVADAYAYPSLVLGGPQIILVSSRDDVRRAFAGAAADYAAQGFTVAHPDVTMIDDQGAGVVWVGVQWTYSSADRSRLQLDAYRYLLRHSDDGSFTIAALTAAPTDAP